MMKLFLYLSLCIFIFSFSGCSTTWYYGKISSPNPTLFQEQSGQFIVENDMVDIIYSFHGDHLYANIAIINNLDTPVMLDKKKSLIVTEKKSVDFFASEWEIEDLSPEGGWLDEELPEDVFLIPPESHMNCRMFIEKEFAFEKYADKEYHSHEIYDKNHVSKPVLSKSFLLEDSPFYFGTRMEFYTLQENGEKNDSLSVTNTFFLSELVKTKKISPDAINNNYRARGDVFYLSKGSKTGSFIMGTIALAGIIIYSIGVEAEE
ncbi:MAG: hypothetical protein LUG18_09705 [Candidatus Azobacteroides sp.]|nr:hypothetical protein [Candidatus Azobacteroides sp.]